MNEDWMPAEIYRAYKEIESAFGESEGVWLIGEIDKVYSDNKKDQDIYYEYADNFRLACEGNRESVNRYKEREAKGCCAYADFRFGPSPKGNYYLYGFNWGH